jgi:hypothetical protein
MHRLELFHCSAFDEVLKYINELSEKMSVPAVVTSAEILWKVFREKYTLNAPNEKAAGKIDLTEEEWTILTEIYQVQ